MSKNLERVIQRAISDAAFRRQLQSNPEAALRGFKLTQSEVAALRSGDAGKLTSLGIDQRMSKTFTFGAGDVATRHVGGDLSYGSSVAADPDSAAAATRVVVPGVGDNLSVGDPIASLNAASTIADPDNPASARGYIGDPAAGATSSSMIGDPDNPASARGYIGDQAAAPTSDAIEDQSHAFSAGRSADVGGSNIGYGANYPEHGGLAGQSADVAPSARGSVIGDPDNPVNARGYIGEQDSSAATASNIGDPDNAASARTYTGGQAAPTSDALEDQSHAFAASHSGDLTSSAAMAAPIEGSPEEFAFSDQAAGSTSASVIGDPDNPASARGFIGDQAAAPTSDALEDQSHAIAASRSDAFLSEGEVSQYSADTNLSSGQADDAGQLFNTNASDVIPDDADTASVHHEPDIPT